MLRFLRASLATHGYRLVEATTGSGRARAGGGAQARRVLLDLGLPDIDGLEVTRAAARVDARRPSSCSPRAARTKTRSTRSTPAPTTT